MNEKGKNPGSFETINPDRRKAVRNSLEDRVGEKNVNKFLEGGYKEKRGNIVREVAEELGLSRTVVQCHIKTLELSEDHEWILRMADGDLPTFVKALVKAPSDRTETEKDAIEESLQKESDGMPSVTEMSRTLLQPLVWTEWKKKSGLPFKSMVRLARELDRLAELPLEQQVAVVLEVIQEGHGACERALRGAEMRMKPETESDEENKTTRHEVVLVLDGERYELLEDYATRRGVATSEAAENVIAKFLREDIKRQAEESRTQ